ncbi:hypothetical protein M422DRAFT_220729 [Sphaerobolus stellatus SS14]|nr:hypothetical protein M422DRAFT_220729 [Sphaerobolus stellatus SS14]
MGFTFGSFKLRVGTERSERALTTIQRRAYALETEENFRWISSFLATRSKHILTEADSAVDAETYSFLSEVGQYAELAHGSISPTFVFQNIKELCQPGYPLEGYPALARDDPQLVQCFKGTVADLQGYVAFRRCTNQLVIAFSGTSSPYQALRDVQAWMTNYPRDSKRSSVHFGFWKLYEGVRAQALEALKLGVKRHSDLKEIIFTGHSMGCTMCYLFVLDLLYNLQEDQPFLPKGLPLSLVVFGSPRLGNDGLSKHWRRCLNDYREEFGLNAFREFSIKAYNDGVHSLPLYRFGFRHLTERPFYLYHGHLYHIPASEKEHGLTDAVSRAPSILGNAQDHAAWPRGGHNYYFRDIEDLQRRMAWLSLKMHGELGWKDRYRSRLNEWEKKWRREEN